MQPIDQQLQALNMDIACGVMNTVVIGDLQKVIENHNSNWRVFLPHARVNFTPYLKILFRNIVFHSMSIGL